MWLNYIIMPSEKRKVGSETRDVKKLDRVEKENCFSFFVMVRE